MLRKLGFYDKAWGGGKCRMIRMWDWGLGGARRYPLASSLPPLVALGVCEGVDLTALLVEWW